MNPARIETAVLGVRHQGRQPVEQLLEIPDAVSMVVPARDHFQVASRNW